MTLITRSVTNTSSTTALPLAVPGFDANKPPVSVAPSATLDLFTVLTDDELEAIQPLLAELVADGHLTVAATVNTASFNPLGNVPVLTASKAVVSDGSGAITTSTTTAAEIVFVHGVTSAIQTQLNAKQPSISTVLSAATIGGGATESVVVTGLLTTSTILAVSQSVAGGNNLPLLAYTNSTNGHLTLIYSADMGAGAKVVVSFV